MKSFDEKRFDTGEIELNYAVGTDNGPALLLIPGQATDWSNYTKVMPRLSREFQVFTVDLRGHGKSDWATGDYSFKTIGADMTAFWRIVALVLIFLQ